MGRSSGATRGVVSSGTTYTQTYNTTATTVPAVTALAPTAINTGAVLLIGDAATAIGTLQTALNAAQLEIISNRKLINKLVDDLQAAGISA